MNRLIVSNLDSSRIRESIVRENAHNYLIPKEISMLVSEIKTARIVEPSQMPPDVVTMNSIVKLSYDNGCSTMTIQLVYPEEADIKSHKISIFAPIAIALLGSQIGSVIEWNVSQGNIQLKIEEILYQPEAAGDYHL